MKNKKQIVSRILTIFLMTVFIWYFLTHIDSFRILLKVNLIYIYMLAIIYVGGVVVNGLFVKWSITLFGKNIRFIESIKVSIISTVGNIFAPSGSGLAFRAVYLKKKHNLAYSDYVSIVFCNYILAFFVNAILGLCALGALISFYSYNFVVLTIFFTLLLIVSVSAFFVRIKERRVKYKNKFINVFFESLVRITNGWNLILTNKKVAVSLFALTVVNVALMIFGSYLIMSALGIYLSIASLILFSVIGSLSLFINITPGNLGVKETIYVVFSEVIGLTTPQILAIAVLDRVILFIVIFVLWIIYGRKSNYQIDENPGVV